MCIADDKLHFCTCDDTIDKSRPHWILERKDHTGLFISTNGMIKINIELPEFWLSVDDWILEQLNSYSPFDFDYLPQPDDRLTVVYDEEHIEFVCNESNDWRRKHPFGNMYDYNPYRSGYISVLHDQTELDASGYIYIGADDEKPNICKIGHTSRSVSVRATETTNPDYYIYHQYALKGLSSSQVENLIHQHILNKGIIRKVHIKSGLPSEWFECTPAYADNIISEFLSMNFKKYLLNQLSLAIKRKISSVLSV